MKLLSKTIIIAALCIALVPVVIQANQNFSAQILSVDPPAGAELDAYDKLYLRIQYESEDRLRFKVVPLRNGLELEYGTMTSSTMLWPAGKKEALAWLSFSTATRVDEVLIIVLGPDWSKVDQFGTQLDTVWTSIPVEQQREPAEWVQKLIRKNRLRQELAFDPNPQSQVVVYDTFFYVSVVTIPFFLLLQGLFLRRWRGRWREMAAIPIISITPMVFMAILGLGIEFRLWIIFIFRGMPLALIYLVVLWFAKWMTERKDVEES